jgi:DNA-binding CsgD family transcriptional regulator
MNNPSLTTQELTKYLTTKTFSGCDAYAVYLMKLNSGSQLEIIDSFGLTSEQLNGWNTIPLSEDVPATDAVKEDRMVWLATSEEWEEQYPHLRKYPGSEKLQTLVNAPLYLTGSPIGILGVMCGLQHKATSEEIAFLDVVAGLVSLFISKTQSKVSGIDERAAYLTNRQIKILEFISHQMTNMQIAKELGFSESTIRHETMRIYELLEASGRREAVVLAKKLGLIN